MTLEVDGAGGGAFLASGSGLVFQCQGVVDYHAVVSPGDHGVVDLLFTP